MTDLRDRLDDLLAEVPPYVVPDGGAAWRDGARRRARRRVLTAATLVGALALVAGTVAAVRNVNAPQPADTSGPRPAADTYPARIDAPLLGMGGLPDRPGPIAGLLERLDGWLAVGQHGQLWRVPGATVDRLVSISPDGSRIAYVVRTHADSELIIRDLVTGAVTRSDVWASRAGHRWLLRGNGQTFWSPDSTRLLVPVHPVRPAGWRDTVSALVVGPEGATTRVARLGGDHVEPVGWVANGQLGWLRWVGQEVHADVVVTRADGTPVTLAPAPVGIPVRHYLNASVMPPPSGSTGQILSVTTDARQILISNPGRQGNSAREGSRPNSRYRTELCPASWGPGWPFLPVLGAPRGTLLQIGTHAFTLQLDPALGHASCSVWASQALQGGPHPGVGGHLFGDRTDWLSWHWRQVAVGVGAGLAVLLAAALVVVRRRRKRP